MSVLSGQHLFDRDVPRFLESPAGVLPPYPRRTWLRWAMRGVLALPLIVVVVRYALLAPEPWHDTANQALLPRVRDGGGMRFRSTCWRFPQYVVCCGGHRCAPAAPQ